MIPEIPKEAFKAALEAVRNETRGSMHSRILARAALEAAAPLIRAQALDEVGPLIAALIDPDDCWFDHHGGCQAHGYLSLEPGEMCPQLEAKAWVARAVTERGGE